MRLKYEKVIHHAIVNNLFGLESMKKSCNAQGSSKYYLFVTASFIYSNNSKLLINSFLDSYNNSVLPESISYVYIP